ncbi:MAG: hypothetical protein H6871_09095 [Methylobacteriaceae bacterium]|nr:hypothetical protein [Methylobacteriaceae bacterium]
MTIPLSTTAGTLLVCINADGPVRTLNGDPRPGDSAGLVFKRIYTLRGWHPFIPEHVLLSEIERSSNGCALAFHRARFKVAVLPRQLTELLRTAPLKVAELG